MAPAGVEVVTLPTIDGQFAPSAILAALAGCGRLNEKDARSTDFQAVVARVKHGRQPNPGEGQ